jgi:hypothetical protein
MNTLDDPINEYRLQTKILASDLLERMEKLNNKFPSEGNKKHISRLKNYIEYGYY